MLACSIELPCARRPLAPCRGGREALKRAGIEAEVSTLPLDPAGCAGAATRSRAPTGCHGGGESRVLGWGADVSIIADEASWAAGAHHHSHIRCGRAALGLLRPLMLRRY